LNKKLEDFKKNIAKKKVAVLVIGVSNTPLIKYLASLGVKVTAFDRSEPEKLERILKNFEGLDIEYSLGSRYLDNLKGFDVIFRTPGMRYDLPELVKAVKNGAWLTSEMEVFLDLCPSQVFAVTGSDGKTTTTTLIYKILSDQGFRCWLGGNIGTPLLDRIDEICPDDKVVVELSSFQLHTMKNRINTAVVTNVSPNHLDFHKSMDEYVDAKKNIFRYQTKDDKLVLNFDYDITRRFAPEAKSNVIYFSRLDTLETGAFLEKGILKYRDEERCIDIVKAEDIRIPGDHNIENYLAAIAATIDYVTPDAIRKVATSFKGVEHRIEFVRELNGVKFYNSSIDSSPSRTIAALKTFKRKVILIAGGKDKGIPYDAIGEPIMDHVKFLVLIGDTAEKIEQALRKAEAKAEKASRVPVIKCKTYEEAVRNAYMNAKEGDIVLLSPASTSFDMFRNFEERGRLFKDIVNSL